MNCLQSMFPLLFSLQATFSPAPTLLAQAEDPCQNTDYVQPSTAMRELTLEQFGISVMIPENYRAILRNDGSVQVVNPGIYNLIRCEVTGGDPLGRGFSELVIRQATPLTGEPLEATVNEAVLPDQGRPGTCVSPYPLAGKQGYLVQTSTRHHAEYRLEPYVGADITVIETSCDCSGMTERLVEVLGRTELLEADDAS